MKQLIALALLLILPSFVFADHWPAAYQKLKNGMDGNKAINILHYYGGIATRLYVYHDDGTVSSHWKFYENGRWFWVVIRIKDGVINGRGVGTIPN